MADERQALSSMSLADLLAASESSLFTATAADEVLAALHLAANAARAAGAHTDAQLLFSQILRHNTNDHNVRVALAQYAESRSDYAAVAALLDPVYGILKSDAAHARAVAMLAEARLKTSHLANLEEIIAGAATADENHRSQLLRERIAHLKAFLVTTIADRPDDQLQGWLRSCCAVFSEFEMLRILVDMRALDVAPTEPGNARTLLALIAICQARRWERPRQVACELLDRSRPGAALQDVPAELWKRAGLPIPSADALKATDADRAAAAHRHHQAKAAFANAPTLDTAREVWRAASARPTPSGGASDAGNAPRNNRLPRREDEPLARLWYMITWHENADPLLRLVAMLAAPHVTVVVSVGGATVPREIEKLTTLLLIDRVQLMFRPVVTWGGQKLLFQNTYSVMQAFLNSDAEWLHIICNRSFPLMGPREAGRVLAAPDFIRRFPGVPGPPAWRREWPDEVVDHLDAVYDSAIHAIFADADIRPFARLADADYKLNSSVFNFSDQAEILEKDFKDGAHGYYVSPFGTDMRWMSFSRLGEFIDVSTETGKTFTRRLPPFVAKWVRAVIDRNELRTGDPFVLMTRRYADVALNDPGVLELYAAMNLGFAPEMNFFDTVAMTERFGVREEMTHTYFRNNQQEARDEDILQASIAADVDRKMFMRKTWPGISGKFVRNFADKVGAEWPQDDLFVAASTGKPAAAPIIPTPWELLAPVVSGLSLHLRTLVGNSIGEVSLARDSTMFMSGTAIGTWAWNDEALVLRFLDPDRGTKRYNRATSDGRHLLLVPAELVSTRNAWSIFIEIPLKAIEEALRSDAPVATVHLPSDAADVEWRVSRSEVATLLDAMIKTDDLDYQVPVQRPAATLIEGRADDEGMLALCVIAGEPSLLCVAQIAAVRGRATLLMARATHRDEERWEVACRDELATTLTRADLVGRYQLAVLSGTSQIALLETGAIVDGEGRDVGIWVAQKGAVWLIGHPKLRFAVVSQFQRRQDRRWRLSGWGWANVEDRVTFVISPA